MNEKKIRMFGLRKKGEQGYTLLEYCAGAAVMTGVLWASLNVLGGSIDTLLRTLASWTDNRTTEISQAG